MGAMGDRTAVMLLMLLLSSWCLTAVTGYRGRGARGGGEEEEGGGSGRRFVLEESEEVVKAEGGEVRVVRGFGIGGRPAPMHIGFITMEPKTLFIPQYLDSSLILFVHRGEARIGWIYEDNMVERRLKMGDIIHIAAGSTFYMVNTGKGQRLQIICSIDTSESLGLGPYQSFFIGGGTYPSSVLAGFDIETLTAAFNVTTEEMDTILGARIRGPIIFYSDRAADQSRLLASCMQWKQLHKKGSLDFNDVADDEGGGEVQQEENKRWTLRNFLANLLGGQFYDRRKGKKQSPDHAPDAYNLYDRDPDFRNNHGWSIALDEGNYAPLGINDIGVYLVKLTAGSMMLPHVNPTATEYGIVLGGSAIIHLVYPNGTAAMKAEVSEGDVFMIPRYFPFCQIASLSGPFEFFGFTTSARRNRPQFLVGASSILRTMLGPELAAGFGVTEEELRKVVEAQKDAVIVASWTLPKIRGKGEDEPLLIRRMADV
ncbi:vicilin-like seed storage protein At2g28490 [Phoenix dactylifera]|uniref:Vicilin-like seed storage protein At2g28490 n=1 Tax=Phoenix dactylifera TaxID=42345 RepID=A0A8B7BPL4_PHODC|nr:vicilin-like seed storage protein At2g28490 [Phoenix dactylifera]